MGITVRGLEALKPGKWLSEEGHKNEGALRAKGGPNGARFYFRYRDSAGRYDDLPIGLFHRDGQNGLTLDKAKGRAKELRERYTAGQRDLRAVLAAEERERKRQREADDRAAIATEARAAATLGALLTAYVDQLKRDGKDSARAVETAVTRHIEKAWPKLWATPAADVAMEDLLSVIARIADAGKLREAAKLRSYVRAAYAAAIRARQSAQGLAALRDLKITSNPARDLVTIEGASQSRERALSVAELRAYWRRIVALPGIPGALLRFHLLTGGQRVRQLGRLTVDDLDGDAQSVRILDRKGRRKVARIHDVPLIDAAAEALQAMGHDQEPGYLFTLTSGITPASYESLRDHLVIVRAAMEAAGELDKGPFTVGDLRRTIETRLAAVGVTREDRSQLQSHGLGGVQSRHYDKHEYLSEKRAALETLYSVLVGAPAKVTPIRKKAASRE
jgi:integrase